MKAPVVSVLMTAYNREKYIAQAIESVLASSFRDFELIVVDDCSSDRTAEIAEAYRTDPRVTVIRNAENLGDYPNRNRAARDARGEFLKYADSDDAIYPHGLECMVRCMRAFPDAALGICRPPSREGPYPQRVSPAEAYREHFLGGGLFGGGPGGAIIRTDAFRALHGFSGKRFIGDTEMWLRLAARHPVVKMPGDLTWWRVHPGQEYRLGQASFAYAELDFQVALAALTDPSCPLAGDERQQAICRLRHAHARNVWRIALRCCQPRAALQLYRDSGLSAAELLRGLGRRC